MEAVESSNEKLCYYSQIYEKRSLIVGMSKESQLISSIQSAAIFFTMVVVSPYN